MPPKPTKRERKDEAKRRRLDEMKRRQRRSRMRKVYTWVVIAAIISLIAVGIGLSRASGEKAKNRLKALATAAGCDAPRQFPSEGQTHVADQAPPQYKTNPPTSGNHFNSTLKTGIFAAQPPDGNAVHNLEHGHNIFWYLEGQVSRPTLEALARVVQTNPTRLILAPRAAMQDGYKIAFAAWRWMEGCKSPTENPEAVAALATEFIKQHLGQGPEGDRPGQPGQTTLPPPAPTATASPSPTRTSSPRPTATPT